MPVTQQGTSRLLALPAELRNRIYEFAFADVTVVFRRKLREIEQRKRAGDWRVICEPRSKGTSRVLRCQHLTNKTSALEAERAKWSSSISGILVASKQTYKEAVPIAYETCTFFFELFKLARTFLRNVGKANLESVRSIQLQHKTQAQGPSGEAKEYKQKADKGFWNMCDQLVKAMPKPQTLSLDVQLVEDPNEIVPHFAEPERTFTVQRYEDRSWLQAIGRFAGLKDLRDVSITCMPMTDRQLLDWFCSDESVQEALPLFDPALGPSVERQHEQIMGLWTGYFLLLHATMRGAMEDLILGLPEERVWKRHLQKLREYRAFCYAPQKPVAVTLENREYKAFITKWDEIYEES